MRPISRVASSECPPSSKKLSSMPTRASPSTSANSPHRISSCGVARRPLQPAPRPTAPAPAARAGRACRSASAAAAPAPRAPTAPCSSGSCRAERRTKQRRLGHSRPGRADHVADQPLVRPRRRRAPPPPPATRPPAAAAQPRSRPARSGSRAASPAHRRGPGTPARRRARQRARSPVRYIRARRRSAHAGRRRTAPPSARRGQDSPAPGQRPAMYSSPSNPGRHRLKPRVQDIGPRVPDRPADRHLARRGRRRRTSASRRSRPRSGRTGSPAATCGSSRATWSRSSAGSASPLQMIAARTELPQCRACSGSVLRHVLDERLQHRRHEVQRRHAVLVDRRDKPRRIAVPARRSQHQPRPHHQRPEELPHRHVEAERRLLQHHVAGARADRRPASTAAGCADPRGCWPRPSACRSSPRCRSS